MPDSFEKERGIANTISLSFQAPKLLTFPIFCEMILLQKLKPCFVSNSGSKKLYHMNIIDEVKKSTAKKLRVPTTELNYINSELLRVYGIIKNKTDAESSIKQSNAATDKGNSLVYYNQTMYWLGFSDDYCSTEYWNRSGFADFQVEKIRKRCRNGLTAWRFLRVK